MLLLLVVQVKMMVWEWRWHERRGEHRGSSLEVEDGVAEPAVRWMRDVKVLLWTTSSGKRLRLGGGRRRVCGFADFRGLGVRMGGRMGWEWGTMA